MGGSTTNCSCLNPFRKELDVTTCFLFAEHLTNESCLALRLDDQGQLDAPLENRTFDAIRALQVNARTVVVLPTEYCSLHQVALPRLGESRARTAITYALEEQIAQAVTAVHVAFDRQYYENKHYLAAVIDKAFLGDLMRRLDEALLDFNTITLDWFALRADEACISETSLLVHDDAFNGALGAVPAEMYLSHRMHPTTILAFDDSAPALIALTASRELASQQNGSFYTWVAQRLFKIQTLNLCQGEMHHKTREQTTIRWKQAIAALALLWLFSFIVIHGFISHQLTTKIAALDQKIAVIYHAFFPQSHQVISPKFRVEQLLKKGYLGQDSVLWQLDDKLAAAIKQNEITVEQLRYQNQILSVNMQAQDFAALEGLQRRLQRAGVKVTQVSASSHEQHVAATLELRL